MRSWDFEGGRKDVKNYFRGQVSRMDTVLEDHPPPHFPSEVSRVKFLSSHLLLLCNSGEAESHL